MRQNIDALWDSVKILTVEDVITFNFNYLVNNSRRNATHWYNSVVNLRRCFKLIQFDVLG